MSVQDDGNSMNSSKQKSSVIMKYKNIEILNTNNSQKELDSINEQDNDIGRRSEYSPVYRLMNGAASEMMRRS